MALPQYWLRIASNSAPSIKTGYQLVLGVEDSSPHLAWGKVNSALADAAAGEVLATGLRDPPHAARNTIPRAAGIRSFAA